MDDHASYSAPSTPAPSTNNELAPPLSTSPVPDSSFTYKMTEQEILQFVKLRVSNKALFTGRRYSAKLAWRQILTEMGLQRKMTAVQARKKWDNLLSKYKAMHEQERRPPRPGSGVAPLAWPHYKFMDDAMQGRLDNSAKKLPIADTATIDWPYAGKLEPRPRPHKKRWLRPGGRDRGIGAAVASLASMAAETATTMSSVGTAQQTRGLISFRVKHQDQFMKKKKYVSKKLWEIAVKQLGLEGIVTGVQAGKKWENLKMKYGKLRSRRTDEGELKASYWRFFPDMHAALGGKPATDLQFYPQTPGDPVPILMAMVVPQMPSEDATAPATPAPASSQASTPAASASPTTASPPPCKRARHDSIGLDFFQADSLKEQRWHKETEANLIVGEPASSGIMADHHPNEMELMVEDSGDMVWVTPMEGCGMTTGANQTANQIQEEEEQDRLEIEQERALLDSERILVEREREVLERERILLERERAGLQRELASLDRDRASLERDRATVERERAAVDWERAMLEKERTRLDRDRLTMGIDAMAGRGVPSMVGVSMGVTNGRTNSVAAGLGGTDGIKPAEADPECVERRQKFLDLLENLLQKF